MQDEDIEILDLDEEIIYTKKEVIVEKKVVYDECAPVKKIIENKKDNMGIGQKLFLIISILFIIGCFVFYGYRTYHYYHLTHDIVKNITLKEKLTALNNIEYQNDGLYEKSGYFYYKGLDVNNYVYYSGRLFRIIDINDGIRMIEDETTTNLVWTFDSDYKVTKTIPVDRNPALRYNFISHRLSLPVKSYINRFDKCILRIFLIPRMPRLFRDNRF